MLVKSKVRADEVGLLGFREQIDEMRWAFYNHGHEENGLALQLSGHLLLSHDCPLGAGICDMVCVDDIVVFVILWIFSVVSGDSLIHHTSHTSPYPVKPHYVSM